MSVVERQMQRINDVFKNKDKQIIRPFSCEKNHHDTGETEELGSTNTPVHSYLRRMNSM